MRENDVYLIMTIDSPFYKNENHTGTGMIFDYYSTVTC